MSTVHPVYAKAFFKVPDNIRSLSFQGLCPYYRLLQSHWEVEGDNSSFWFCKTLTNCASENGAKNEMGSRDLGARLAKFDISSRPQTVLSWGGLWQNPQYWQSNCSLILSLKLWISALHRLSNSLNADCGLWKGLCLLFSEISNENSSIPVLRGACGSFVD